MDIRHGEESFVVDVVVVVVNVVGVVVLRGGGGGGVGMGPDEKLAVSSVRYNLLNQGVKKLENDDQK